MAKSRTAVDNVLPFPPTHPPANVEARNAVKHLARERVIDESEAVRSLYEMGATPEEIDFVRAIYAVRRGRV